MDWFSLYNYSVRSEIFDNSSSYGVLVLKRGKGVSTVRVEISDSEGIKGVEENGYKYIGILEYKKIE